MSSLPRVRAGREAPIAREEKIIFVKGMKELFHPAPGNGRTDVYENGGGIRSHCRGGFPPQNIIY